MPLPPYIHTVWTTTRTAYVAEGLKPISFLDQKRISIASRLEPLIQKCDSIAEIEQGHIMGVTTDRRSRILMQRSWVYSQLAVYIPFRKLYIVVDFYFEDSSCLLWRAARPSFATMPAET